MRPSTSSPISAASARPSSCRGGSRSTAAGARPSTSVGESDPRSRSMASTPVGRPPMRASPTVPAASCAIDRSARRRSTNALRVARVGAVSDHGVPVVAVQPGRVEQMIRARRDGERGGDRGDADDGGEQRRAHRHRGPAATGLERHAHTGHAARREAGAREPDAAAAEDRGCRAIHVRPRRPPGGAQRREQHEAAVAAPPTPTTGESRARPGFGLRRPGGADRGERREGHGDGDGERTGREADGGDPRQAEREELAAGHPERPQERMLARLESGLARQRLPDEEQRGERRRAPRGPRAPAPADGSML